MTDSRPPIIIPPALKPLTKEKRWVVWKWVEVKGKDGKPKRTKPPFRADAPSKHASSTDPATWRDLDTAMLAYTEGRADGIGFVLTGSNLTALDVDNCRNVSAGAVHPYAQDLVCRSGSYAEVTPSGEGIRVIGTGNGPPLHRKFNVPGADGVSVEVYRKAERYITITGLQIDDTISAMAELDAVADTVVSDFDSARQEETRSKGNGQHAGRKHDLESLIKHGCGEDFGGDRSRAVWYVINTLLKQGKTVDDVIAVLLERSNGISAHIYDQSRSEDYARKQVEKAQKQQSEDPDVEITRLAKLSALEYDRQRKAAADKLDVRASILDKLVEAERARLNPNAGKPGQGEPIEFPEPEPWPDEVKGAELLNEIAANVRAHVVMPEPERDICALWAVYAHLVDCFLIAPRLAIRSPTPECGKTTLLSVLQHLVPKPLRTSSVTAAVTFRVIAMCRPTLLIDEAKNIADKADLLEVLNDGHHRGGRTLRNVPIGDGYEPRAFATFAALAIALIGSLPPELHGRSLVIDLKRRRPGDEITEIRVGRTEHLDTLARKAVRWAADNAMRIADMEPAMPVGIYSRAADNWKPLLAVADAAGGEWPQRARDAAIKSHAAVDVDDASMVELLLADIRTSFAEEGKAKTVADLFAKKADVEIASADLVEALVAIEGRPWAEMGKSRKPLTRHGLAKRLKPLGIGPGNIGPKDARIRGYKLSQFEEAFSRYLPPEGVSNCTPAHNAANTGTSDISRVHTPDAGCAVEKCEKSNNDGLVGGCAVAKGGTGAKTRVDTIQSSDGMPLYTGPPVEVPDQGADPLDMHGAPRATHRQVSNGGEPGLSGRTIRGVADEYTERACANAQETGGDTRTAELDAWLRQRLAAEGVRPEHVETEFARVMQAVFAGV
jgi:Protein of unknown function (DUF3631)